MSSFLIYVLKSTFCIVLLYLLFRSVMRKETFFALNRMVLLTIVTFSFIIPWLYLPSSFNPIFQEQIIPEVSFHESVVEPTTTVSAVQKEKPLPFSTGKIIFFIYLAGMLVSLLYFVHGIISVLLMIRRAQTIKKDGYRLFILEKDIPAFSFCRMIFISKADYNDHGTTILAHEQQHIRLGHFYDLLLMEMAKIMHWFNPIIYWLVQDLKAIHEFQADQHTLTKGIDARKYQLLIIEKGVGPQRLALANSFNHCQIKKRITMMNQSKNRKAGLWKVATFLPLLALLLMAFGRTGENVQINSPSERDIVNHEKTIVKESAAQSNDSVNSNVEVMPQFPGGDRAIQKFLNENIKYPKEAEAKHIQGKVFVNFIITDEGKVTNPKIVKSENPALDAEALRVISIMPPWTPAKVKGKYVRFSYTMPINFVLSPGPSDKAKGETGPPPPPPNKDMHIIKIYKDGSLSYNYNSSRNSFDEMADIIKKELRQNPKLKYNIWIEEGKIDDRLDRIKSILITNGNPEVHFFAFYIEKVPDSEGKSSTVTLKPLRSSKSFAPHGGSEGK